MCKVEVKTAVVCPGGVPYLGYTVTTEGVAPATVDVVWVNPTGADVTLTGQPLSGSLLWAGATAGVAGQGAAWARPTVEVRFLTTPEASVVVTHPTTTCSAGGASAGGAGTAAGSGVSQARSGGLLSATGLTTAPLLAVAGGLLVLGTAAVLVTRRRHVTQD